MAHSLPQGLLPQRWLVTGASGLFGSDLCRRLSVAGCEVLAVRHGHPVGAPVREAVLDLHQEGGLAALVQSFRPDVALHAAGLTNVDACESDEAVALRLHAGAARELAIAATRCGGLPVLMSTDHLWAGTTPLMDETSPLQPMNAYARTKAKGEESFLDAAPEGLVVRTNFFGAGRPWRRSFSDWIEDTLRSGQSVRAFTDVYYTPIALAHLSDALCGLVAGRASGVFHVAGSERISKFEFARRLALSRGLPVGQVLPGTIRDAGLKAPRPLDMSLSTRKIAQYLGYAMPRVEAGLETLEFVAANG